MSLKLKHCEGCEPDIEAFDHIHQYLAFYGDAVTTFMVDGIAYTNSFDLEEYLIETYEVTGKEARDFIYKLPRKYS